MFFDELILATIICLFCTFLYSIAIYYLNDKRFQKIFFLVMLLMMTTLLMIYCSSNRMLIFLDVPLFLGYLNGRVRDSLYITFVLIVILLIPNNICWELFTIKYILFIFTYILFKKNKHLLLDVLLGIEVFFYTIIYFKFYKASVISFLYLIMFGILFYFLICFCIKFLKLKINDFSEEQKDRERIVFRIVHEIKNPIAVCKGYLEMLDLNERDKATKYIKTIKSEMNRSLVIMDDFLSVGNINVKTDILDIYMLLEDLKNTMDNLLSNNNIVLEIPNVDKELYILGDYDRLKQVFMNLVKNSFEAKATFIKIRVIELYDKLEITVTDNGEGIDKETLKRIGEIFFTTKSGGSGIGVNLSKKIISLHHGEIKFNSRPGLTRASIFLPIEKGIN